MARSLRSKRRKRNKQVLRERYKPKYDAQLQAIVANMQKETEELMETAGNLDFDKEIQITDPDKMDDDDNNVDGEGESSSKTDNKIKLPKVEMAKVAQFMSQRKKRRYAKSLRIKNETLKKTTKLGGVQKNSTRPKSTKPKIKW